MKTGLIAIVCAVLGFVAGVFAGPSIRGGERGTGVAAVAKSAEAVVDELFCGEAKDGELVEIELDGQSYGQFRLSPKQKELFDKKAVWEAYRNECASKIGSDNYKKEVADIQKKYVTNHPWFLDREKINEVNRSYQKLVISLLESRKKAAANK